MRKVLYLITQLPEESQAVLFPSSPSSEADISVVLLQDAVRLGDVPGRRVYALREDAEQRGVALTHQAVSYQDILRMVFEADSVITV